jgi:S1-C subfamily serine protease
MVSELLLNSLRKLKSNVSVIIVVVAILVCALPAGIVSAESVSISQLYQNVRDSVVVVTDSQPQSSLFGQTFAQFEGSGFVYNLSGRMVVVTNFHVIDQAVNISVTFQNGDAYAATILGFDPYVDLGVLSVAAPANEFTPLHITSSSTLKVGDFVAAFGSPFGLSGSITTGIVSQLGRTITETTAGNYLIADVIQTDAPINPGNSGGPLTNANGEVVGINTAGVSGSQGVGFAIPSSAILRELPSLVNNGAYNQHPYLGIGMIDNNYDIANQTGLSVTYGVLLEQVTAGGPADKAGLKAGTTQATVDGTTITTGGDVIIAINQNRIVSSDDLSTYVEENAQPNQTITVTAVRNGQTKDFTVVLGTRPAAGGTPTPTTTSTSPAPTPSNTSASTSPNPETSASPSQNTQTNPTPASTIPEFPTILVPIIAATIALTAIFATRHRKNQKP